MKTITLKNLFAVTMTLVVATSAVSTALAQSNYEPYSFATLAGMTPDSGGFGGDGTGSAARFYYPSGVAVDSAGNVYVADTSNHTIRKITPSRVVSTLAGLAGSLGSANGAGCAARFYNPSGVAVDSAGNVYVADEGNSTIRKITPSGVSTFAGLAGTPGSADGTGSAARFNHPRDVAVDNGTGNVYVADSFNNTIRKITPSGVVTTFAGSASSPPGSANGTGSDARFHFPRGVAVDSAGNVYVADTTNDTIRKITPSQVVTTFAGSAGMPGSDDGTGSAARFYHPREVAVDNSTGNVYVGDSDNHTIRKITPSHVVTTFAGSPGMPGSHDGTGSAARFYFPLGVAVDNAGNVYVADRYNYTIRKITPSRVVSTFAGSAGTGSHDGTGSAARFNIPYGVAVDDSTGNIYVADTNNHTIRKITPSGEVSTFAGSAGIPGSDDGTGSAARFNFPRGVAVDNSTGNVYVGDTDNHTIRKITPSGVVITFAGLAGHPGSANGTGSDARFSTPSGVAVDDSTGNVYVADSGSGSEMFPGNHTIRKITPSQVVTTFAGLAGHPGSADGTGSDARFYTPEGVAVDSMGNVYVADSGSESFPGNSTIRKITPSRVVSTLAGLAGSIGSADGTGSAARFNGPSGVAVDSVGKVYVADTNNNTVRVGITAPPVITTVGQLFVYRLDTTGTTSFMVSNLPPGLNFDPQLAAIVGAPTAAGTFQAVIMATYPAITTQSPLTITVQPVPGSGPVITSGTSATSRVGRPFSFQVYTHTTNGSPAPTVSATGLPPGLSVDPVTGIISGSVATSGSSLVTLTVTDGSLTTTATLQLTFTNDRALPIITSSSTAFLYPGQYFSYTITVPPACDPAGVTTFALLGMNGVLNGTLPPGLTFDAQTRTISGFYMGESSEGSAGQSDTSGVDPLIDGDDVISPDRTIRPRLVGICQPFATNGGGVDQPFVTNGSTGTVPLNFFFGGPTTDLATDVASFSATLNGAFAPDGLPTTIYFQYGTTTGYGFTTPVQTLTGNNFQTVSANISSLSANTIYHFRMVAHNTGGTSYGSDKTFTTLSGTGVPVVITNPASLIASFSATLNGTVLPHGLITNVYFQYGTTTSYGSATPMQTQNGNTYRNVVANISSLSASTTYHFRIVATNNAGTVHGADRTFTTLRATGPPVVRTNPATDVTSSSATLNGSLDPHGLTTNVNFQYGTTTSYGHTTPMQSQTGNTYRNIAANISGLSTHTTYHFRVVATNSAGTRNGADRTFTTP
jgi:DNA-binding beta-propeller fold protein YncE